MKRLSWIDILRAIAIIYVVIGHTFTTPAIQNYIWSFQVPLFFFISGMLFKDKKEDFKTYVVKKFKTIMIPYFFFGIVFVLIYAVLGKVAASKLAMSDLNFNLEDNFLGLLYGSAKTGNLKFNLPLWFLPCLFSVSVIYYGISHFFIKKPQDNMVWAIVFGVLGYLLNYHTTIKCLPWGIDTAITMLVFYMLGRAYKENTYLSFEKPHWLLMILLGWYLSTLNGRVAYSSDTYNNIIIFYLACLSGIAGYICLAKLINKNKVLEFVGQNTLAILVMHKLPLLFFQVVIPLTRTALKNNNIIIGLLVDVVVIALCLVAAVICKKIMPWALGERKHGAN